MASKSLTTIVIAHRLSTVRKCDRIALVADGKVREIGTYDELMAIPDGRYRRMQAFQSLGGAEALSAPLRARAKQYEKADEDKYDEERGEDETDDHLSKEKEKRNAQRARLLAKDDHYLFAIGGFGALLTGVRLAVVACVRLFFFSTGSLPCSSTPRIDYLSCLGCLFCLRD